MLGYWLFFLPDEDQKADRQVVDAALPWLESDQYDLIFIHLDQVDYAGHRRVVPRGRDGSRRRNRGFFAG